MAGGPADRRSPWTRPKDIKIALVLVLGVAVGALAIWATSESAATESTVATSPAPKQAMPFRVPTTFTERWRAPSAGTPVPVTEGSTVVTGDGGEVIGRDPLSGQQRWRYARDIELCTVGGEWSRAVAMYTGRSGCSEVTALDADSGRRVAQRNGDAEPGTQLIGDGSHLVTTGTTLINVWSQDLLRTMEIGRLPAAVNPGKQPRAGCSFTSMTVADEMIGTVGRCPGDDGNRLIVFKTTHYEKNESRSDEPKEIYDAPLPRGPVHIVAVSDPSSDDKPMTAVALGIDRKLMIFGPDGKRSTAYELDLPANELSTVPARGVPLKSRTEKAVYWFTGSRTVALAEADLRPKWTLNGTIGTGTLFAGKLLAPIPGGIAVVDEDSGRTERTIAIDRGDYRGPVRLAAIGTVLLEQRGDTLVALR